MNQLGFSDVPEPNGRFSVESAIQLRSDLTELMLKGGFRLRKWCSNSLDVLASIPSELLGTQSSLQFDPEETIKTRGISWEPKADVFRFVVSVVWELSPTKRNILSVIAQLYDPLGLIAPVIVLAKIVLQELWFLALEWDVLVPPELRTKWLDFYYGLHHLNEFRIDRHALAGNVVTPNCTSSRMLPRWPTVRSLMCARNRRMGRSK